MRPFEIRPGIRRLFRLAVPGDAPARRADADAEIRLHLQLRAEQLAREGLSPEAARAEAERRFGPIEEARLALDAADARRDGRRRIVEALGGARQGLRTTLRGMWRTPGFLATAVTCIALGVGANAAAYSLVDELLLRPLPVREPARLVDLGAPGPKPGGDQCNDAGTCAEVFSLPMYRDLERGTTRVAQLAAHRMFIAGFAYDGRPSDGLGVFVSGSYFPVLGVRPALGRLLRPDDDVSIGAHPVAVVSHAYWTSVLGGDPAVVGRTLLVNGRSLTIVGVAPRGFEGTTLGQRPRVYVPIAMASTVDPFFGGADEMTNRRHYWVYAFARLRPGQTLERAHAALNVAYHGILADVEAPLQKGMSAPTLARFKTKELTVADGRHGQSVLRGTTRTPLTLLLGITGLVVLIACANIANLLLVRGAGRATEIAVRISLGAGRRQLVAQLLTEAVVLAIVGGLASLLVARALLVLVGSFLPDTSLGMGISLSLALRPSVLLFAGAMSLGTGLLFGLFPALHATRPDLIASIRAGAGQIAGGHRAAARFRSGLVTTQIALSMALLGTAGLFIQSLRNIGRVDLGMDVDHAVTFALLPELSGYDLPRARVLLERAEREIATIPGVTAVGAASVPLFTGSSSGGNVRVEGFVRGPDTDANTRMNEVGPGYFRALGVRVIAGREFTDADRFGAPKVAIVSEAFARKFGLGRSPVGKRLAVDDDVSRTTYAIEIVGLVRDANYSGVKDDAPPLLIRPIRQDSIAGAAAFYVGTTGDREAVRRAIPAAIARIDRNLPVPLLKPLAQQVRENVYLDRMVGTLSAGFAALATLLAAVGLYGVLAYTVAQRAREIGVRMALGADAGRVRGLVLRQVLRMALVGAPLGIGAALLLGRAAQSLLFGLRGFDPAVVLAAAFVLTIVTLGAGYLPAWRASRVDPVRVLRGE